MCGENEPQIRIYRFENNGMGGPTEDTIEGVLENVRSELEHWAAAPADNDAESKGESDA